MPDLIPDEFSEKFKGGWELPEKLKNTINDPHVDASITPDDIYEILANIDDEVLWWIINNDSMTFCEGFTDDA